MGQRESLDRTFALKLAELESDVQIGAKQNPKSGVCQFCREHTPHGTPLTAALRTQDTRGRMHAVISRVHPAPSTSAVPDRPVGTRRLAHHGRWSAARPVTARQAAHATFGDVPVNFGRVVCRRAAPLADGYERALCAWRHGRVDDAKNAFGARPNPAPLRT